MIADHAASIISAGAHTPEAHHASGILARKAWGSKPGGCERESRVGLAPKADAGAHAPMVQGPHNRPKAEWLSWLHTTNSTILVVELIAYNQLNHLRIAYNTITLNLIVKTLNTNVKNFKSEIESRRRQPLECHTGVCFKYEPSPSPYHSAFLLLLPLQR